VDRIFSISSLGTGQSISFARPRRLASLLLLAAIFVIGAAGVCSCPSTGGSGRDTCGNAVRPGLADATGRSDSSIRPHGLAIDDAETST